MLTNYLKIALRNLLINKGYAAINIGGLALGMGVAMLIALWVFNELSFNKYHRNYGRIVQVMEQQTVDSEIRTGANVPIPLEKELRNAYGSDFKHIGLGTWTTRHVLGRKDASVVGMGNFMSPEMPEMLSLKMQYGNRDALKDPSAILLSASVAQALFGSANPINQLVRIDNELDVRVGGVYEDIPASSAFNELRFIAPWDLYVSSTDWVRDARDHDEWDNSSFQIFAQLADRADIETVNQKIRNIKIEKGNAGEQKFKPAILLFPMSSWHLHSEWKNGVNTGGRIENVWLFGVVGAFVLLLACVNFMNLSTARSEKRSKEVGIRKAIGSARRQLVVQFFTESYLIVILASVVALALDAALLPLFNEISGKELQMPWDSYQMWTGVLGFCVLTGLLAGSYPALYLSAYHPSRIFSGSVPKFLLGLRVAMLPRKVLVVLQFTVSVTLIVGTVVVYRQIQFAKNRPLGYDRQGLVTVHVTTDAIHKHMDAVRDDLVKTGSVIAIAESHSPTTDVHSVNKGFKWKGKPDQLETDFATIGVSHDYGKTVGWKFLEGRDFVKNNIADSSGVVINRAAARVMGMEGKAAGETIRWFDKDFKILGVVDDMIMTSPYEPIKQTIFFIPRSAANFVTLRINPSATASKALSDMERVFKKYDPASPFDYQFVDQEYALKFAEEERVGKLALVFAVLAVFISCLGLFGLAAFVCEQRSKELGIRKALGASVASLWQLVSSDFVILVITACALSVPISWYLLQGWLEKYQYRTEISWSIYTWSAAAAVGIALVTVSYQSVKAALVNPVEVLKNQ